MANSNAQILRTGWPSVRVLNQPYTKPYRTINEQIELLESRGMDIRDRPLAAHALRRIGYYRLSGYWYPFRQINWDHDLAKSIAGDEFRSGSRFEDVIAIYGFDRQLRLLFLDAIERIEVALRVEIALLLGQSGAMAHRDSKHFRHSFTLLQDEGVSEYAQWMDREDLLLKRSSEEFARHYRHKYAGAPPIWIAIELWDFGTLTKLMHGLSDGHLDELTDRFQLPRRKILVSLCQSINFVRNICAHHGRLWNRPLVQSPARLRPGEIPLLDHVRQEKIGQQRLYAVAAFIRYLLLSVNPETSWPNRLKQLYDSFPSAGGLSPAQSGFAKDWQTRLLWQR